MDTKSWVSFPWVKAEEANGGAAEHINPRPQPWIDGA